MKFFHIAAKKGLLRNFQLSVVADRECGALEYAKKNQIDSFRIDYRRENPDQLRKVIKHTDAEFIVTNWHKIIDSTTVGENRGKIINLHYSLLPAFAGLIGTEPIRQALQQGCRFIGPTCHFVDEGLDTGPIIGQAIIPLSGNENEAIQSMFKSGCLLLLNCLQALSGTMLTEETTGGNNLFRPKLSFDDGQFDDAFWEELKNA